MHTSTPESSGNRRRRTMTRRSCIALIAVASVAGATPADARPVDQDTFHDVGSEEFLDENGDPICPGLDIEHGWDVSGSYLGNTRGRDGTVYYRNSVRGTEIFTNVATGRSFTSKFATSTIDKSVVDNGDGTLSIVVQGSGGSRWYDGDGQLVLRDPGMTQWEILIDHGGTPNDPFDDEFLAFIGIVRESTGLNESHDRDFCEDIGLFTS